MFEWSSWPDLAVFVAATLLALGGGLTLVRAKHPVYATLGLLVSLTGVALFFLQQGQHVLAAIQVIVYGGAIVVMFLFVIMLLGVDRIAHLERPRGRALAPLGALLAAALVVLVLALVRFKWNTVADMPKLPAESLGIEAVAELLFGKYLLLFEGASLLLVIAVVGAVSLVRRESADQLDPDIPDTPDTGAPDVRTAEASTKEGVQ